MNWRIEGGGNSTRADKETHNFTEKERKSVSSTKGETKEKIKFHLWGRGTTYPIDILIEFIH